MKTLHLLALQHMISTHFNPYLFRHFTPYCEHFQFLFLRLANPYIENVSTFVKPIQSIYQIIRLFIRKFFKMLNLNK